MSSQLKVMLNCEDGNTKRDTKKDALKHLQHYWVWMKMFVFCPSVINSFINSVN